MVRWGLQRLGRDSAAVDDDDDDASSNDDEDDDDDTNVARTESERRKRRVPETHVHRKQNISCTSTRDMLKEQLYAEYYNKCNIGTTT